jgi:hypothetical protein
VRGKPGERDSPPRLLVQRPEAKRMIGERIEKGLEIKSPPIHSNKELKDAEERRHIWSDYNRELLKRLFDSDSIAKEYDVHIGIALPPFGLAEEVRNFKEDMDRDIAKLRSVLERLDLFPESQEVEEMKGGRRQDPTFIVKTICSRFHSVSRQLKERHDNRPTLEVNDEYDVQDLLHALLKVHFDDIRREEWTPSYAGGSSRMDLLLKKERIVVEVKKTRPGMSDKEVGNQLIEDTQRYQTHPDCKVLICFVYDPDGRISNPRGLERDLSRQYDGLTVEVLIFP